MLPTRLAGQFALWTACLAAAGLLGGCSLLPPSTEADVQRLVAEDDQMRISELRVRGETRSLTVQPKNGAKAYNIVPAPGGQDPSQAKDSTGQRVWPVLSF